MYCINNILQTVFQLKFSYEILKYFKYTFFFLFFMIIYIFNIYIFLLFIHLFYYFYIQNGQNCHTVTYVFTIKMFSTAENCMER